MMAGWLVLPRPLSQWGPLTDKYCPRPQLRWAAQAVTYSDSVSRSTNCTELTQVPSAEIGIQITRHFQETPKKRSLDDALMIRHVCIYVSYVYNQFLSSLSISFRFEEIGQCSWQQLDQDHDTFSGQLSVFAPETLTDAERLGTRSWPVWPLHSLIILIAVFEGQQH